MTGMLVSRKVKVITNINEKEMAMDPKFVSIKDKTFQRIQLIADFLNRNQKGTEEVVTPGIILEGLIDGSFNELMGQMDAFRAFVTESLLDKDGGE